VSDGWEIIVEQTTAIETRGGGAPRRWCAYALRENGEVYPAGANGGRFVTEQEAQAEAQRIRAELGLPLPLPPDGAA